MNKQNTNPPEGERAKLAGEVTEGDRALADRIIKLYLADRIDVDPAQLIADHVAAAVAEAESKVAALEALVVRLREALDRVMEGVNLEEAAYAPCFHLAAQALALVPADLAEMVLIDKREFQGWKVDASRWIVSVAAGHVSAIGVKSAMSQCPDLPPIQPKAALQPAPKV